MMLSVSGDDVITQFHHYDNWLQSLQSSWGLDTPSSNPQGLSERLNAVWLSAAGIYIPPQPATCWMMCLKPMMHLSWSLSTIKESPLQSGSADSVTNTFHWLQLLHNKSPSLFSHLTAFILKQRYGIRCVFSSSNWTRLLKQLKVNAMKQFENTKRTRETKEIQSEAMKVLRAEHADFKKTSVSQVSCTDLSWAVIWGVLVTGWFTRETSPQPLNGIDGSRGSILASIFSRIESDTDIWFCIFVCACVSML